MNVYPVDWYEHFTASSPVCKLISKSLGTNINLIDKLENADIILIGAYGEQHRHKAVVEQSKAWKLFVTGENVTPDLRYYHHSLSFCRFDFGGRNFRWPVWYQSLSLDGIDCGTFSPSETSALLETNRPLFPLEDKAEWNKVVAIFNNCEPIRCNVYQTLDALGLTTGFGVPFGNALPWGDEQTYKQKVEVLQNFGFNLCFENSMADGYYTEKILHARAAGCVPLVYGDPHIGTDFNLDSCINLYDFDSVDQFCDHISSISSSKSKWKELANGTVFSKIPDTNSVQEFLRSSHHSFTTSTFVPYHSAFDHMKTVAEPPPSLIRRFLRKAMKVL